MVERLRYVTALAAILWLTACGSDSEFRDVTETKPASVPITITAAFWGAQFVGRVLATSPDKMEELCGDSLLESCLYNGEGNLFVLVREGSDQHVCVSTFSTLVTAIFPNGDVRNPFRGGAPLDEENMINSWCDSFSTE